MITILLAAGSSRRMGTPKPLLMWHGEPLVRHMAWTLRDGGAASALVVIAPDDVGAAVTEAVACLTGVEVVVNPAPERGMLSSVQEAIRSRSAIGAGAFLVCPCDVPKLRSEHVAVVVKAWRDHKAMIVTPTFRGRRGHPTVFGAKLAGEILRLNPVEFGLNEILKRHARDVHEVVVPDDGVLRDADTPEEWRALQDEITMDRGFRDAP
jgi:CTP:molybdopterin cytidylyltransferase MocA